jgi:probable glucitol transport protein GutA
MAKALKDGYRVGALEKASYGMVFFGQNIFYGLIGINIQTFFSDVGITAASVALILLVTKVWDAVNDPLFGIILDKVRFKSGGRFLPWLRISIPCIAISSLVLFAMPAGASPALKIIWAIVGYIAWDMSYTLCDVPLFVLPTSMTDNIKERTGILAIGRYLGTFGIMLAIMLIPAVQASMGWMVTGIIYSVLGTVFMLPAFFKIKERHIVRPEKQVTFREMAAFVLGNKFLLIFYVGMLLSYITNFSQTLSIFFARYNMGDQALGTLLSLANMIPTLIIGAFIPLIIKKVDKFNLYVFGNIAVASVGVLRYFVGYGSLPVYIALSVVQGIFSSATSILIFMFTPDCLEYGTFHTGERAEGIAASVQTFFVKLMGSLAGPLAMLIIGLFGFVEGENAAQPQSALDGIWLCMTVFPAIGVALATAVWSQYKLRDKDVQVMAEYNSGQITKGEADAKLATKYGPAAKLVKMTITSAE